MAYNLEKSFSHPQFLNKLYQPCEFSGIMLYEINRQPNLKLITQFSYPFKYPIPYPKFLIKFIIYIHNQTMQKCFKNMKFNHKMILTISIVSLLSFLIIDIIMTLLYQLVLENNDIQQAIKNRDQSQFINLSLLSSTANYMMSGLRMYEQIITEIAITYKFFKTKSPYSTSHLVRGVNPPLTSTFIQESYDHSSVYFMSDSSSFYDEPEVDSVLASSFTRIYPYLLRRVNVFYQSKSDPTDIMARTVPATADFTIPDPQTVTDKFNNVEEGKITLSESYTDKLSKSDNVSELIALRTIMGQNETYRSLIEVQMYLALLNTSLKQIYSFQNSGTVLINKNTDQTFAVLGSTSFFPACLSLEQVLKPGSYVIEEEDCKYDIVTLDLSKYFPERSNHPSLSLSFENMVMVNVLDPDELYQSNYTYHNFFTRFRKVLFKILVVWSIMVIVMMGSVGYVVGNNIMSYFQFIKEKCNDYLKNPESINKNYFSMKEKASKQKYNRLLLENLISIIQKIQTKKKMHNNKNVIGYDLHPLNLFDEEFQDSNNLNDHQKFKHLTAEVSKKEEVRQQSLKEQFKSP